MASERSDRVRFKDSILEQTAKAVKEVQALSFSLEGEQLEVRNEDRALQRLAEHLDHIFLHGLRHVTPGYWAFVQNYTHKDIIDEIKALNRLSTDLGRSRAWLYKALNESSLESYVNCFLEDQANVKKYYIDLALLRDRERLCLLQTLISGLDFVSFKLELNIAFFDLVSHVPRSATERQSSLDNLSLHSCDSSASASPAIPETPEDSQSLERPEIYRRFSSKSSRQSSIQDDMILERVVQLQRNPGKGHLLENGESWEQGVVAEDNVKMGEEEEVSSEAVNVNQAEEVVGNSKLLPERPSTLPVISYEERFHVTLQSNNHMDIRMAANGNQPPGAVLLKDKKKRSKKKRKSSKKSVSSTSGSTSPSILEPAANHQEHGIQELLDATVKTLETQDLIGRCSSSIDQSEGSVLSNDNALSSAVNDASTNGSIAPPSSEIVLSDSRETLNNNKGDSPTNCLEESDASEYVTNHKTKMQTVESKSVIEASEAVKENSSAISVSEDSSMKESRTEATGKIVIGHRSDIQQVPLTPEDSSESEDKIKDGNGDTKAELDQESDVTLDGNPYANSNITMDSVTGDVTMDSVTGDVTDFQHTEDTEEHHVTSSQHNQSSEGQSYESLFSAASEVFAGIQELKSPGDGASETESEGSVKLRTDSQIESLPWMVKIDSNTKLHLMLEVFQHSDEKFLELFQVCSGHNQGEVRPGLILISSWAIYLLRNSEKKKRYKVAKRVPLEDLDTITVSMNFQMLFIIYKEGKNAKTLAICTKEEDLSKMIIDHVNVACKDSSTFPPSVVTDTDQHKKKLQAWASMECRQPVADVRLYHYSLLHWDDATVPSAGPDLSVYKQVIYKAGNLSYKTKESLFLGSFWQPGYFELKDCILSRYSQKGAKKSQWSLQLSPPDFTGCRRLRQRDRNHCFEILQAKGPSYMLSCDNERKLSSWLSAICQVMAEQQGIRANFTSGTPVQPCCSLITSHKLLLFHEDSQTSFLRCLATCDVTSLTCLKIAKWESQYIVLEFLPSESETPWILYFFSCKEAEKFQTSLCTAFHDSTQRILPVEHLEDNQLKKRAKSCLSAIKSSNGNRSPLNQ